MELTGEQKIFVLLSHLCIFFGLGIILPILLLLLVNDEFVKDNARSALAFQIMIYLAGVIAGVLCIVLIGFLLIPIVAILGIVLPIIATVKSFKGETYSYPISGNFLKGIMNK